MATIPLTITNYGLLRILQDGTDDTWLTLDASNAGTTLGQTAPGSEILTNGGGRHAASITVTSAGGNISQRYTSDWEFTGAATINAACLMALASGSNLMGRGVLPAPQNVGSEDIITVTVDLVITQVV